MQDLPIWRRPYFYPRSPCGERHGIQSGAQQATAISIHALLAESDLIVVLLCHHISISIHALLAESDRGHSQREHGQKNFYPRSPCGERLQPATLRRRSVAFLSTLSLRRATKRPFGQLEKDVISIHALLAESDWYKTWRANTIIHFYPRSPCGERHHYGWSWYDDFTISIHALLAESDPPAPLTLPPSANFYPRSPCGERLKRLKSFPA